jgi:hypothetical protein
MAETARACDVQLPEDFKVRPFFLSSKFFSGCKKKKSKACNFGYNLAGQLDTVVNASFSEKGDPANLHKNIQ